MRRHTVIKGMCHRPRMRHTEFCTNIPIYIHQSSSHLFPLLNIQYKLLVMFRRQNIWYSNFFEDRFNSQPALSAHTTKDRTVLVRRKHRLIVCRMRPFSACVCGVSIAIFLALTLSTGHTFPAFEDDGDDDRKKVEYFHRHSFSFQRRLDWESVHSNE